MLWCVTSYCYLAPGSCFSDRIRLGHTFRKRSLVLRAKVLQQFFRHLITAMDRNSSLPASGNLFGGVVVACMTCAQVPTLKTTKFYTINVQLIYPECQFTFICCTTASESNTMIIMIRVAYWQFISWSRGLSVQGIILVCVPLILPWHLQHGQWEFSLMHCLLVGASRLSIHE